MKFARVRLEDIAKLAGVHKMTVSRALRDDRRISVNTRKRIQKLARKLGYRPNPLVSMYQAHVRSGQAVNYQATIGWINDHENQNYWHNAPWTRGLFEGALKRAKEMGYTIDEIWLDKVDVNDPDENIKRYIRIIRARGIHGIILPCSSLYSHAFHLWPDLAVAVVGLQHGISRLHAPLKPTTQNVYHTVSFDYFGNMRLICEKLREAGYRRIGLLIGTWLDAHSDHQYRGSFLAQQLDWPRADHVPILFEDNTERNPSPQLAKWLDRYNPEVVICSSNLVSSWLKKTGKCIPENVGLAHLYLAEDVLGWSGIDPNMSEVGSAAVDLIIQQLRLNERGFPQTCHDLFISGRWVEGQTTKTP